MNAFRIFRAATPDTRHGGAGARRRAAPRRTGTSAVLCGLAWFTLNLTAPASTYYVATNGNDTSSGLAEDAAFRTLQKAVNTVNPGDTILLLPGNHAGARIQRSGADGAPIALRPAVPGTVTLNALSPAAAHQSTLELETFSAPYVVRHWIVEGLRIVNSGRYGIDARSTQFLVIRGNTVSNSASTGIFTAFSYDALIEGNTSVHNGEHGIYYNNSSDRFVIRGNTLHHNRHAGLHMNADVTIGPPAGTPWVWDGAISDGLVENNEIFANGKGGAGINMDGVERTLIRNNVIYNSTNNSGIALFRDNAAIASRQNRILNNTVIMGANNGGWAVTLASVACVSNVFLNNIIYSFHTFRGTIQMPAPSLDGLVSDYNCVANRFSVDGGGSVMTLAAWRTLGYDAHSFVANPTILVVNVTNDMRLRFGSIPAIDAGTPVADVTSDRFGVPRPLDGFADGASEWDVGAHEVLHPLADSDDDGFRDGDEVAAGTEVTNPVSRLALTAVELAPEGAPTVQWASVGGRTYALLQSTNLFENFAALATNLPATPPTNVHTVETAQTATYLRVAVETP